MRSRTLYRAALVAAFAALGALVACGVEIVGQADPNRVADGAADAPSPPPVPDGGGNLPVDSGPVCLKPPAGMIGWWPGDDSFDARTDAGAARWVGGDGGFGPGKVASAFDLLDGSAYLVTDTQADGGSFDLRKAVTIEAWIFARRAGGRIIDHHTAYGSNGYMLDWFGERARFVIGAITKSGITKLPVGEWVHVAGTYDGAVMRLYVNGIVDALQPVGDPRAIPYAQQPVRIGGDSNGENRFDGLIDEPAVYQRALSQEEIAAIVRAGPLGRCKSAAQSTD